MGSAPRIRCSPRKPEIIALATNVYEGLFIFDGNKFARDQAVLPAAVEKMITEAGGQVKFSQLWEERRLAYPIKGQRKGAYWLMYFELDSQELTALNRKCELRDGLLRQLILKIHDRLVDPILSHALESQATPETSTESEEEPKPEPAGAPA